MAINTDVGGAGPAMKTIVILRMGDYFADTGSPTLVKPHAIRTSVQHAFVIGGLTQTQSAALLWLTATEER